MMWYSWLRSVIGGISNAITAGVTKPRRKQQQRGAKGGGEGGGGGENAPCPLSGRPLGMRRVEGDYQELTLDTLARYLVWVSMEEGGVDKMCSRWPLCFLAVNQ